MPQVILERTFQHEQVEFPKDVSTRPGVRGNLPCVHLQRGRVRDLTDAELDHIREHRPDLYDCLRVLPEPTIPAGSAARSRAAHDLASRRAARAARDAAELEDLAAQQKGEGVDSKPAVGAASPRGRAKKG